MERNSKDYDEMECSSTEIRPLLTVTPDLKDSIVEEVATSLLNKAWFKENLLQDLRNLLLDVRKRKNSGIESKHQTLPGKDFDGVDEEVKSLLTLSDINVENQDNNTLDEKSISNENASNSGDDAVDLNTRQISEFQRSQKENCNKSIMVNVADFTTDIETQQEEDLPSSLTSLRKSNNFDRCLGEDHDDHREKPFISYSSEDFFNINTKQQLALSQQTSFINSLRRGTHDPDSNGLYEDAYSIMMVSDPCSRSTVLCAIAFLFQMTFCVMTGVNQINMSLDSSVFNVPFKVEPVVRGGQFLGIIFSLLTQTDIITSIQVFVLLGNGSRWIEEGAEDENSSNIKRIYAFITNTLKLIQGECPSRAFYLIGTKSF